jgi:hypothetical protein
VNEPVLLKLCIIRDPDSDRDLGLARFVLDAIRSHQEAVNKQLQYEAHAAADDRAAGDDGPVRRHADGGVRAPAAAGHQVPGDAEHAAGLGQHRGPGARGYRAGVQQNEIPSQVEAGKAIQALIDRDENARAAFVKMFTKLQARMMHRCLNLVARYYDTPRLITVTGDFGTEVIEGFKGAQLMHQTQVRVSRESLASKSREAVQEEVGFYAQLQWIGPEDGISAIKDGTTDAIGADFEYDRAGRTRSSRTSRRARRSCSTCRRSTGTWTCR